LIELVDLNDQRRRGVLSHKLKKALEETIARKEQAILFINRRGFHRYLKCGSCDWIARCPQCAITLVRHGIPSPFRERARVRAKAAGDHVSSSALTASFPLKGEGGKLVCHQCNFQMPVPAVCPSCKKKGLYSGGVGTERVIEELKEHMPWVRAARWDTDAVKKKGALADLLADVRAQELDVLVGTQLVAQGFHFPHVTLVGVVDADVALHLPNFRAAERTFQLLMQVAGRAGRDVVMGRVLIQTHQPNHSALMHAQTMDFEGFFQEETTFRKDLGYPPFTHLIEVEMSHKDEKKSAKEMDAFLNWAQDLQLSEPVRILGPMVPRRLRRGRASLQCILKVADADFDIFLTRLQSSSFMKAHVRFDVDPL
jgi:primosomal protein N' (replication factor Y)